MVDTCGAEVEEVGGNATGEVEGERELAAVV